MYKNRPPAVNEALLELQTWRAAEELYWAKAYFKLISQSDALSLCHTANLSFPSWGRKKLSFVYAIVLTVLRIHSKVNNR